MRFGWCKAERLRIEEDRRAATPGRRAYQRASARLAELDEYEILLTTQLLHFWRQAAVREVEVRWVWAKDGSASVEVLYSLDELALSELDKLMTEVPDFRGDLKPFDLAKNIKGETPREKWIENLEQEVVEPERKSQYLGSDHHGYQQALLTGITFGVGVLPSDSQGKIKYV